jgi:hypothetical protein
MADEIESVRAGLNDLFRAVNKTSTDVQAAVQAVGAGDAVAALFADLVARMRGLKSELKSDLDAVAEQLCAPVELDELIDESDAIELVEAVRDNDRAHALRMLERVFESDGDRAHALRMLERVFERDARLVAAIQQATYERPRVAA